MFATLKDIYLRFGKENVLATANLDADDPFSPAGRKQIESRIYYFLKQAYETICDALRQGTYEADTIQKPYPKTLVNLNCEVAYVQMYQARHSNDETPPDAYSTLENNVYRMIRNIQGGAVRFDKSIKRAVSIPFNVDANFAKPQSGNPTIGSMPDNGTDFPNIVPLTSEDIHEIYRQVFLT